MYPSDINDVFRTSRIASTGLKSARTWMNIVANNIANANTLDTGSIGKDGNFIPYHRQVPVFQKILSEKFRDNKVNGDVINGVRVEKIAEMEDVKKVYDPFHPGARKEGTPDAGYVYYPGVDVAQEMADMRVASAAYEANLAVIGLSSKMNQQALSIGRSA